VIEIEVPDDATDEAVQEQVAGCHGLYSTRAEPARNCGIRGLRVTKGHVAA
jgi:hypothetical protein